MSLKERKYLYSVVEVDNNKELDYLSKDFTEMDLETSTTFRIPQVYRYRPDLISLKFFGNYHMGWLISLHNNFLDPIFDFKNGRIIDIPDMDDYFRYYKARSRRRE